MDFQRTKEARRDTHGKPEEGSECPLDVCGGGSGHSKDRPKNDSLEHRHDSHNNEDPGNVNQQQRHQPAAFTTTTAAYNHVHHHHPFPSTSPSLPAHTRLPLQPPSEAMNIPAPLGLSPREYTLLRSAKKYPPVTKKTLSELDLPCIMSNINLRMDANFDNDLHFKPDLDGEKGKRKRKEAADFWEAMAIEISVYAFCAAHGLEVCRGDQQSDNIGDDEHQIFQPRLPSMFETLQDVLKTLVSERDHPSVMQNLEVPLLMQQIRKGVLDMVGLANWLAALLKTHCAPMRDEWADRMVKQISLGSRTQDSREIVRGLQTLFAILEAMKLDVANHQIRAFRVLLIEDTVPFLQEYFRRKIERDNFRVESSRRWYLELREQGLSGMNKDHNTQAADGFWPVAVMFNGLFELLLQFHMPDGFPETFVFDSDRLWQLRSNVQNLINLDICWYIFESYIHSQKRYLSAPAETYSTFRSRIWTLMEENDGCHRGSIKWLKSIRNVSLEIARFACAACSSNTVVSDEVIAPIEAALEWHLSNESGLFQVFQRSMQEKLVATTFASAKKYLTISPLAICESQRQSPFPQQSQSQSSSSSVSQRQYDVERIGMRLAHIGVLHWRVWAPILYAGEEMSVSSSQMAGDDDHYKCGQHGQRDQQRFPHMTNTVSSGGS